VNMRPATPTDETLKWVPEAVRIVAACFGGQADTARRLLTDERMREVWRTLQSGNVKVNPAAVDGAGLREELLPGLTYEESRKVTATMSVPQQALASFFCGAMQCFFPRLAPTAKDVNDEIARWRVAANMCDYAAALAPGVAPFFGRPTVDPELARALAMSSQFLREIADHTDKSNADRPFRDTDNNLTRSYVLSLAAHAREIYGNYLYHTTAVVASVGLDRKVEWRQVRQWCDQSSRDPANKDAS
jgi:hypothetical protein